MTYLNYNHLRCFAAVVEEGGVVPAAESLGVSHPTVSEQLRKLEEQLELSLFDRRGRRLVLTDDGEFIYGYAAQIFGIGDALVDAAEGRRTGTAIVFRVGVDSVLSKLVVRKLLSPLIDRFGPSLRMRCVESDRDQLFGSLRARQLDLVLSDTPAYATTAGELNSDQVMSSAVAFFAHPSIPLEGTFPGNLDGAPFLLPMSTTRLRRELERWFGEHGLRPHVVAEVEDSGLLKAFGQEARGVFAMPADASREITEQYGVRVVGTTDAIQGRVFAIARGGSTTNHAVAAFLERVETSG